MCERCEALENDPRAQAIQDITVLEWIPRVDPDKQRVYVHQAYGNDDRLLRWRALNLRGQDRIFAVRTVQVEVVNN